MQSNFWPQRRDPQIRVSWSVVLCFLFFDGINYGKNIFFSLGIFEQELPFPTMVR